MRLTFCSSAHVNRAARSISRDLNAKLSTTRETLARAAGYRDWHDLAANGARTQPSPRDEELSFDQFSRRAAVIVQKLVSAFNCSFGDALFALGRSRLTGNRLLNHDEHTRLWLEISFRDAGVFGDRRMPGCVVKLKSPGRMNEICILRKYDRPSHVITNASLNATVADFEMVCPRMKLAPFIPMRLFLPYGCWRERSGSVVLFSRDYAPLWRIFDGRRPERLQPTEWIRNYVRQEWFWDDNSTPWRFPSVYEREVRRLIAHKAYGLPRLCDLLVPAILSDDGFDIGEWLWGARRGERVA